MCTVQYVCLCLFVHMTVIKVRTCLLVSWLCCPSAGACCCTASWGAEDSGGCQWDTRITCSGARSITLLKHLLLSTTCTAHCTSWSTVYSWRYNYLCVELVLDCQLVAFSPYAELVGSDDPLEPGMFSILIDTFSMGLCVCVRVCVLCVQKCNVCTFVVFVSADSHNKTVPEP